MDNIEKNKSLKLKTIYIVSGFKIGFLNGVFGGGGGMIAVPLLQNVLKLDTKTSHASAIFIILPLITHICFMQMWVIKF